MVRVEKSIVINAPVEKVFAYINDPTNSPGWSPGLVEVQDVVWQEVGKRFRWTYKMAGLLLHGEMTDIENVPNERIVGRSEGGAVSTWTWTFEPHDGGTKLNLVVEYTIPIPVLGKVAEVLVLRQNERDTELGLANVKDRMEA
jgi:uncharacterized membrane protein